MLLAYHHIQINVPIGQENAARDFYCDVLGLGYIEKPDIIRSRGGFWLQVGDLQLHIGTEEGVDRSKTKSHVAYRVDDVEFWRQKLAALNIQTYEGITIPGVVDRLDFRDPFDNKIEFIQVE